MEKNRNKEIRFAPVTDGLGFHPFSEGLPYAPAAKPSLTGTGAVAAGTPRFATQIPQVALPVIPSMPVPGIGYLFKRVAAYGIDSALNVTLSGVALVFVFMRLGLQYESLLRADAAILTAAFLGVLNWALIAAQEIAFGTSFGKRVFRLALDGSATAIFLRSFFFAASVAFFGVGLVWSVLNRRRRCWHDMIVDLQPIEIARL